MKNTRIVDKLGRIVLPAELRREMDIKEGEKLDIDVEGDRIILTKSDVEYDTSKKPK